MLSFVGIGMKKGCFDGLRFSSSRVSFFKKFISRVGLIGGDGGERVLRKLTLLVGGMFIVYLCLSMLQFNCSFS